MQGAYDARTTGVLARARLRLLAYLSGRTEGPMSSRCDGSYGQRVVSHFGPPARGSRNSAGDVRCRSTAGECRAVNTNVCERGYSEEASAGWQQGMVKACGSTPVPIPSQATGSDGSWVPLSASDGLRPIEHRSSSLLSFFSQFLTKMGDFHAGRLPGDRGAPPRSVQHQLILRRPK